MGFSFLSPSSTPVDYIWYLIEHLPSYISFLNSCLLICFHSLGCIIHIKARITKKNQTLRRIDQLPVTTWADRLIQNRIYIYAESKHKSILLISTCTQPPKKYNIIYSFISFYISSLVEWISHWFQMIAWVFFVFEIWHNLRVKFKIFIT